LIVGGYLIEGIYAIGVFLSCARAAPAAMVASASAATARMRGFMGRASVEWSNRPRCP